MSDTLRQIDEALQAARAGEGERAKQVLKKLPGKAQKDPDALYRIAIVLYELQEWRQTVKSIDKLHRLIKRETPETLTLQGVAQRYAGGLEKAARLLERALKMAPGDVGVLFNLGNVYLDMDEFDKSAAVFEDLTARTPDDPGAHERLGVSYMRLSRLDDACHAFENALKLEPSSVPVLISYGGALYDQDRYEEAEDALSQALALAPGNVAVLNNRANARARLGRYDAAEADLIAAVDAAPENTELRRNLGLSFIRSGKIADGRECLETVLESRPDDPAILFELGNTLMCTGNEPAAWELFHHRMQQPAMSKPRCRAPWWDGSSIAGRKLLVWSDQGIGDMIMFSQLLLELPGVGMDVTVHCDHRLGRLFADAYPNVNLIADGDGLTSDNIAYASFDLQTTMTFLARFLRPTLRARTQRTEPYLQADREKTAEIRQRYTRMTDKPIVGIAWKSGNRTRSERNLAIRDWGPVLSKEGFFFVNLQYGDTAGDVDLAKDMFGADIYTDPDIDQMTSLDDFAAQIAALDKVVSISNTTVHFAGALGCDTRVMLPKFIDWRYGTEEDRTAWYPDMRLYRQSTAGDWSDVVVRAADDL